MTPTKKTDGFSAEERAAMKERAKELKAEARASKSKAEGENETLAKINEMPEPEQSMAKRLHEIIRDAAPELAPKLWYGMPAYARDGKVICFFQSAQKFGVRYSTLGFTDSANLDEGGLWATSFAIQQWTEVEEAAVLALVQKAIRRG